MAKKIMKLLCYIAVCLSLLTSCSIKKDTKEEEEKEELQPSNVNVNLNDGNQEDNRITKLDSLTFEDTLAQDWGFVVRVIPVALDIEINLGVLVRDEGSWTANYGGGFAACEIKKLEILRSESIRFYVDIWMNEDPERPFAERNADTPVYSYYIDLSESDFRAAVRKGVLEKKQVVVIPVKAYNLAGEPVGEWFRDLPSEKANE